MATPTKALFFLPDISGFTRFVNETEINHSSHIISELLEIIIKENTVGLEIAEIEGDAIFFYKLSPKLSVNELIKLCRSMFLAFHSHLKRYEKDRICQCGACTNASKLTLKFITHTGEVLVQNINNNIKLMGKDVTYAHKLMKNNVSSNEYVLLSSNVYSQLDGSEQQQKWLHITDGSTQYDDIGEIDYKYGILSSLHKEVPFLPERDKSHFTSQKPVFNSITIKKPLLEVHAYLIDMNIRPQWRTPIGRVTDPVERLGTIHDCILPTGSHMDVAVLDNQVEDGKIVYKETAEGLGFLVPKSTEVITIKQIDDNSCTITSEIHLEVSTLKKILLQRLLSTGIKKSLKKFKALCEGK